MDLKMLVRIGRVSVYGAVFVRITTVSINTRSL